MKKRMLNGTYAIEVLNGRLNTSSPDVENSNSGYDNITFTKKIANRGYSSGPSVKSSMKEFAISQGEEVSQYIKDGKKIIVEANPCKNFNEDVFGFMKAETVKLSKEQYDELDDDVKKLYEKKGKEYTYKATKKRKSNFLVNGLIGLGTSKVKKEYGICKTGTDSMPYVLETYSDIMCGLLNFDVNNVGRFIITDNETQFRDYTPAEAKVLGIEEELPKEVRQQRIEIALRAMQYLSMGSNQSNYLVDTMPKVVVLGEYSWGNNVFQGILNKNGINVSALSETIKENEQFRLSKIWIGVSSRILSEEFKIDKEQLKKQLSNEGLDNIVEVVTVGDAFNGYIEYLKETLE